MTDIGQSLGYVPDLHLILFYLKGKKYLKKEFLCPMKKILMRKNLV